MSDQSQRKVPLLRLIDAGHGLADAYNALERDELRNRQRSLDAHLREITAWLGGLGVLANMLAITWDFTKPERDSQRLQFGLTSLALSSSKTALDATLACHYSTAFASCRLGFESAFMIIALELAPELSKEWYRDAKDREFHLQSPRVAAVLERVRATLTSDGGSEPPAIGLLKKLSTLIHQTSIGTHPTKDALYPFLEGPHKGERPLIRYREENTVRALGYGIYLCSVVVSAVRPLRMRVTQTSDLEALTNWQMESDRWAALANKTYNAAVHRINEDLLDQT